MRGVSPLAWRKRTRKLVEDLLQHLTLFRGQVAARFLFEQRQDGDHLRGALEVRLGARAGSGSAKSPKWIAAVVASDTMKAGKESSGIG